MTKSKLNNKFITRATVLYGACHISPSGVMTKYTTWKHARLHMIAKGGKCAILMIGCGATVLRKFCLQDMT